MANEPCWITPEGVVHINRRLVAKTGEPHQLLYPDLLESACVRPRHHWEYGGERDVVNLATILAFAIARNHAFLQGNKRTGFTAMVGFLGANGYALVLIDDLRCAEHMIDVLKGKASEESFAEVLHEVIAPTRAWRSDLPISRR